MRKIQSGAAKRRKWMALGLSAAAALTLWFLGAVVFSFAERKQGFSYFTSLYFAYTTLLTIGYGDLQPTSNSGKPFFVFWSLLAVPTLTVLISNMGDTVVKSFSDFTIWAGSISILPGETGIRATLRASTHRVMGSNNFMKPNIQTSQPPGMLPHDGDVDHTESQKRTELENHALDRLAGHLEAEELDEAKEAGERGDMLTRDMHFYHYVLARELRNLLKDVQASPAKTYSYADWAFFLKLIGQDEADPNQHRAPPIKSNKNDNDTENALEYVGKADGEEGDLRWSWLGTRSPLMGTKSESEWLLERLAAQIEKEMLNLRKMGSSTKHKKPPISMHDLRKGRDKNGEDTRSEKSKDI
jgi:potassium channel subfamily K